MVLNFSRSGSHPLRSARGQFIPIAAMVMLSTLVFMVGLVNVYRISRAKLKAQNLADACALYIASQMTQSVNNIADRNEWLNHLYTNTNDANSAQAGADPCQPNRADKKIPPGLGCFTKSNGAGGGFKFGTKQGAQAYARIVSTVNNIQNLFSSSYNTFIGATNSNAQGANGGSTLATNLYQQMPDLQDPNIQVVVYNTAANQKIAQDFADTVQNTWDPKAGNFPALQPMISAIQYKIQDVPVTYNSCATKICIGNHDKTEGLSVILGATQPIGWMGLDEGQGSNLYLDPANKNLGAGAIVSISVPLISLGNRVVQAKSSALVVMTAGQLKPNSNGTFSPTFWVRLAQP